MEEMFKVFYVIGYYILIVCYGFGVGKENTEYVVNVVNDQWNFGFFCCFQQIFCQMCCQFIQCFVNVWLCDFIQIGEICCYCNWVIGKCICLIDWICWGQCIYYIMMIIECVYWYFIVDDFVEVG